MSANDPIERKPITLATLPQATPLEVFEQGKRHLLTQNAKSIFYGACAYRSADGSKSCAAGCFISDEEHRQLTPHHNILGWFSLAAKGLVPQEHTGLIMSLQRVHDQCDEEYWEGALDRLERNVLAGDYGNPTVQGGVETD